MRHLWPLLLFPTAFPLRAADRPNVIVVMTDDQGYGDVGVHGNDVIRTPHLDRFCREGTELTRFYCCPVCAPTRASLLTGRDYYRTGVIHTSRGGAKMHGDEVTLAELLRKAGYRTGIFGKWHLGDNYPMRPQDQGFEEVLIHKSGGIVQTPDLPNSYFDPLLWHNGRQRKADGYCTDVFFQAAMDFITARRQEPFFVYLPTNAPHTPLEVADNLVQPYLDRGCHETTARVYAMVTNIDTNFGRLLRKLEELKLRERTLIVFLTDNGPQQSRYTAGLRGRKASVYEGGIRVPCFVQWPAQWRGGRQIDRAAAHIDWLPTILDICGVDVPNDLHLDGRSLRPLLDSQDAAWPDRNLFFQCHRGLTPHHSQNCAVVTQHYKLVGHPGTFSQEDFQPGDPPRWELYDLQKDPGEQHDLAAEQPQRVAELRETYDDWFRAMQQTRRFTPGVIDIGSDAENPTHLCRYQDGQWEGNRSLGWPVRILREGRYRVSVVTTKPEVKGRVFVSWQGESQQQPVAKGTHAAEFQLTRGEGLLDVWFQPMGEPRVAPSGNGTVGDVTLERLR